jgi:hypothetical protein
MRYCIVFPLVNDLKVNNMRLMLLILDTCVPNSQLLLYEHQKLPHCVLLRPTCPFIGGTVLQVTNNATIFFDANVSFHWRDRSSSHVHCHCVP